MLCFSPSHVIHLETLFHGRVISTGFRPRFVRKKGTVLCTSYNILFFPTLLEKRSQKVDSSQRYTRIKLTCLHSSVGLIFFSAHNQHSSAHNDISISLYKNFVPKKKWQGVILFVRSLGNYSCLVDLPLSFFHPFVSSSAFFRFFLLRDDV